jgi:hypothetical protein
VDLQPVFVVLVYLAVLSSLGIYGWRLYRRVVHHETREDRAEKRRAARAAAAGLEDPGTSTTTAAATTGTGTPAAKTSIRDLPTGASRPGPAAAPGSLVEQVIREELAAKERAERGETADDAGTGAGTEAIAAGPGSAGSAGDTDGPGGSVRGGLFAPADAEEPAPKPISELVAGISMPCDLSPLVDESNAIDPQRVVFITSGTTPAKVGAGVADELERLGFTLRTDGDTELVATRDGDRLLVTLHPDPVADRVDGERLFPTATRGSVVVVFHTP